MPGCAAAITTAANDAPLAIADQGVVSSAIVVAGAGGYLWDVDVTTNLTHTWPNDLEITLRSPAGTIVTLTTDNGDGHDDVFAGTVWDDSADPDGTIPYGSNDGLVTDASYAPGVVESPLVPEEALAAMTGENPNGTWTLTIADDGPQDIGTLWSWSLTLTTFTAAPAGQTVTVSQATPAGIPDAGTVTSDLAVLLAGTTLCDLDVTTRIDHGFAGALSFGLTSPAGTAVTLSSGNGAGAAGVFAGTRFDDDADPDGQVPYASNPGLVTDHPYASGVVATPLAPEEALSAFRGEDPNGTWQLAVNDATTFNTGTLQSWSLHATTCGCVVAASRLAARKTVGGDFSAGGSLLYTIEITNQGTGAQADNPGDELFDVLPAGLTATAASATTGTAALAAGTATWNGSLAPSQAAVLTIAATIGALAPGTPVANQATVFYDADGDGSNESSALSDDPSAPGVSDPTGFTVTAPAAIPATSAPGLLVLALLLAAVALRALR